MIALLLGKWKLIAIAVSLIIMAIGLWNLSELIKSSERLKNVQEVHGDIEVANEISNRNRSASDAVIFERLSAWQRD